jgi:tetratricopeptide (TPR) repeat protein
MSLNQTNNFNLNNNIDSDMALINNLMDSLRYEEAKALLLEKLQKYPNDVDILDTLSEVLISLDESKEAIKILKKSIELEPEKNPEKYMSLGQLSNYKISLKNFKKGLELYCNEINSLDLNDKEYLNNLKKLKINLSSAYASIADLYMTTDLWYF